ncbi:hypothetical protein [Couchioplanes azureus]|uniref:hypothetical protein n=1 Tax=Couchioplanes caeruleus TaxID=56438 RepID=UPI00166FD9F9|nr:hypothetical protein [Couchioplanes caeruleus]GGQ56978.1 hypothetical protein GCM10010166_28300 [Couchioplanes caeruleus subsp. azureus]
MSQPPNQPPYPEQYPGQSYPPPGPAHGGQPIPAQPFPPQQGYPAPPYQGQPNPDVPPSVPPGYPPQPGYGVQPPYPQPEYGQAGYPQSGPPLGAGYPPPQPQPKSRALAITLVSIAVALVLCVGGGTALYLVGRNAADDVTTSPTAAPVAPSATPERTESTEEPAADITVVEPKTLGGRPRVTDPQFAGAVDELKEELEDMPRATETVGALYGTPAERDLVIVAAVASEVEDPQRELNATFLGAGVSGLKLTGLTTPSAGSLGGVAKCGKGEAGGAPVVVCGWADEGSVGLLIWYYKSMNSAKAEFPKLRAQVEKVAN